MAKHRALRVNVLREEYLAITGDTINALIVNQFVHWTLDTDTIDQYLEEESQRRGDSEENPYLTFGWISKSAKDLARDCMLSLSTTSILRRLAQLVELGVLIERNNPKDVWDRATQYRVDMDKLMILLKIAGYSMIPGVHPIPIPDVAVSASFRQPAGPFQNGESIIQNASCTTRKMVNVPLLDHEELISTKTEPVQAGFNGLTTVPIQGVVTGPVGGTGEVSDPLAVQLLNGKKETKPRKETKPKKPVDTRLSHPAIVAYRTIAKLTPNDVVRGIIVAAFVEPTEKQIAQWSETITEWIGRGWNKANVQGMVEYHKTRTKEVKKRKVLGEGVVIPEIEIRVQHTVAPLATHKPVNPNRVRAAMNAIGDPANKVWQKDEDVEVFDSPF